LAEGLIKTVGGPDVARGPPFAHPCCRTSRVTPSWW